MLPSLILAYRHHAQPAYIRLHLSLLQQAAFGCILLLHSFEILSLGGLHMMIIGCHVTSLATCLALMWSASAWVATMYNLFCVRSCNSRPRSNSRFLVLRMRRSLLENLIASFLPDGGRPAFHFCVALAEAGLFLRTRALRTDGCRTPGTRGLASATACLDRPC